MKTFYASLLGALVLTFGAALSAQAEVITANITTTWYEPDCDPNSIFVGSFSYDTTTHAVTNLKGVLSEAMMGGTYNPTTGPSSSDGISWLSLNNQLANGDSSHIYSWYDAAKGGTFATVFYNTTSLTFSTANGGDGWSPLAGVNAQWQYGASNAYALIFVPDSITSGSTTTLTWDESTDTGSLGLAYTAYADYTDGGLMGSVGMTGTSAYAYGSVGTMEAYPASEVIRVSAVPEPATLLLAVAAMASTAIFSRGRRLWFEAGRKGKGQ